MIEPIILNEYGEIFKPHSDTKFSKYSEENRLLAKLIDGTYPSDHNIGSHDICRGWIKIHKVSLAYNVIICKKCNLRIMIPKEIETYGDLRKYLSKKIEIGK